MFGSFTEPFNLLLNETFFRLSVVSWHLHFTR